MTIATFAPLVRSATAVHGFGSEHLTKGRWLGVEQSGFASGDARDCAVRGAWLLPLCFVAGLLDGWPGFYYAFQRNAGQS